MKGIPMSAGHGIYEGNMPKRKTILDLFAYFI
jgi:hypothetical protein